MRVIRGFYRGSIGVLEGSVGTYRVYSISVLETHMLHK